MPEYTLFVDESGGDGYNAELGDKREDRFFIAVGLAVRTKQLDNLDIEWSKILGGRNIELHYTDIINRRKNFGYLKDENEALVIIDNTVKFLDLVQPRLYVTIMDKPLYKKYYENIRELDPHQSTWAHIICRFGEFLQKHNHMGIVIHDEKNEIANGVSFEKQVHELVENKIAVPYNSKEFIKRIVSIEPDKSKSSRGLQLADMCCGIMRRRHVFNTEDFAEKIAKHHHNSKYHHKLHEPRWFPDYNFQKLFDDTQDKVLPVHRRVLICPREKERMWHHNGLRDEKYYAMLHDYVIETGSKTKKFLLIITENNNCLEIYTETKNKPKGGVTDKHAEVWKLEKRIKVN